MVLNKKYKIQYIARIKTIKPGIKLWLAQPINRDYQKISNFSISSPIKTKYQDFYKNTINYLDFPKNNEIKLEAGFEVQNKFFQKNINAQKANTPSVGSLTFKNYTKTARFLEQTPAIQRLAFSLKKENPLDTAREIFLYTVNKFQYQHPVKKRGIKNLRLSNLKGDCGEYSTFFTTLCRINTIPARINTGFVVFPENKVVKEHAWASVYLCPWGWLDVDSQYGALEKNKKVALKKYFCKRTDNRLSFITNYNIPIKPEVPRDYKFDYWEKQYLPINRKSAQVLQPLIFATKFPVISFKEKIKLN